jgi:hypothetical protein
MRRAVIAAATLLTAGMLTACGATPDGASSEDVTTNNTNPMSGPVFVRSVNSNGYYMVTVKFCDRTTLVYNGLGDRSGGVSVIPNSPECGGPLPAPTS